MLSAIIIVGPQLRDDENSGALAGGVTTNASLTPVRSQRGMPLVCVEVLGRSVVGRMIDELRSAGVQLISVLGDVPPLLTCGATGATRSEACSTDEAWRGAVQQLMHCKENGLETALVIRAGAYVDLDLRGALEFHRQQGQVVTRAFDKAGALDIWILEPASIAEGEDLLAVLKTHVPARYFVSGYVNRLEHLPDLRRLTVDGLTSGCRLRPHGTETRPGIWIDNGAQLHRDARVVAPAYIGRGSRIAEQCLITRCTNVEGNCQIDYGTALEDSSILANTYVGIGLDLSHSIVDGNNLLNLERGVTMEIADPCVIRSNRDPRQDKADLLSVAFEAAGLQFARAEDNSS